ncbi:CPBP family intramembrane glutamic endopeptidase [Flavobacterium sp.]|uniref:CPBP family intramembrane glutamic endopeptidase n=1 Tax=Flavobacterium sp. TaxID=239 RepID=UPI001B6BE277|nr:CPBP family intramembrane glutamic endopeptidase [Flavobacterium sp.]MBP6183070.1 CPBP family intramembrane metalloprotease [Flavobacterium sp.]
MFIEQGIHSGNKFWKYLFGSVLIFGASLIGQLPLLMGVFYETVVNKKTYPNSNAAIMHFLEPNFTLFLLLFSFVFVVLGIYFVIRNVHHQSLLSIITSRVSIDWKRVFFSFSLWAGFTIGSTALFYFLTPEDFVLQFQLIPFLILFAIGLVLFPFQIGSEELIFRGYLMQGFGNLARNKWFPLLMTSLIFGLLHLANPEVDKMGYSILIYYIGTGLFLGIITLMDEGMELALGFHFANNFIGAILVTSDWSAFQTYAVLKDVSNPSASLDVLLPVFIIFPILLVLFAKRYQWKDWKEKLTGKIS